MWCRKKIVSLVALAFLVLPQPPVLGRQEAGEVLVNKDEVFALELLSPIDSKTSRKGDKFDCKVLSPVQYAGAIVSGHIKKVKSSGKANGKSELDLGFDTITLPDGRAGNFNAQIKEVNDVTNAGNDGQADVEGTVKGKSRSKITIKRAAAGAAIGAIVGGVIGGAQGAGIGAAIGAGIGATTTLATEGPNLEFKTGTQFTVLTNAPSRRAASSERKAGALAGAGAVNPPPRATTGARSPAAPSPRYRTYSGGNLYSLSFPDNWREIHSGGMVTLAPDGAYVNVQGQPGYTHCAMVGVVRAGSRDLREATGILVGSLLKTNSYLRQQGAFVPVQVAGRPGLAVTASGTWPATMHGELVTLYTTMTRNGHLFYLLAVAKQDDAAVYQPVFETMVRSVQLND